MRLILWDIDGTLLYSGGVAGECMRAAMERVYGRASQQGRHQYAGKTDRQIILETFPEREPAQLMAELHRFTETYMDELRGRRAELLERGRVLPGVRELLERLAAAGMVQSTLTGNLAPVAQLKLDLMGIAERLDLAYGAFGSDHHERARLPAIATARAEQRFGRALGGGDVVIIGDTPNDIACARAFGARSVAVASGPFSAEQLAEHAPDATLSSLADTDAALAAILGA